MGTNVNFPEARKSKRYSPFRIFDHEHGKVPSCYPAKCLSPSDTFTRKASQITAAFGKRINQPTRLCPCHRNLKPALVVLCPAMTTLCHVQYTLKSILGGFCDEKARVFSCCYSGQMEDELFGVLECTAYNSSKTQTIFAGLFNNDHDVKALFYHLISISSIRVMRVFWATSF